MMTRRRRKSVTSEVHTVLGIEIGDYKAHASAALNHDLRNSCPRFARDDNLVYEFGTSLEITGTSIYPPERANDTYELSVHGHELRPGDFSLTLRDCQLRDESGLPRYKAYRGQQIPVYESLPGLGILEKRRGTRTWYSWIYVAPALVHDMLILLNQVRPLYLSLHEIKSGRERWLQSVSVQTTNPADE